MIKFTLKIPKAIILQHKEMTPMEEEGGMRAPLLDIYEAPHVTDSKGATQSETVLLITQKERPWLGGGL